MSDQKDSLFKVWGVLNLNEDSFYVSSRVGEKKFISKIYEFLDAGVDFLDIGSESSRPFSDPITQEEEWSRLKPYFNLLHKEFGLDFISQKISLDSYHYVTIRKALDLGVSIINDITGGRDSLILKEVANYNAKIILMHCQGTSKTMQNSPEYNNLIEDVSSFLLKQAKLAQRLGVLKENILLDPGIGFGKTFTNNIQILSEIDKFLSLPFSIFLGVSRKKFIGTILDKQNPEHRLIGTHTVHAYLAMKGVQNLRVHDVKEVVELRKVLEYLL